MLEEILARDCLQPSDFKNNLKPNKVTVDSLPTYLPVLSGILDRETTLTHTYYVRASTNT